LWWEQEEPVAAQAPTGTPDMAGMPPVAPGGAQPMGDFQPGVEDDAMVDPQHPEMPEDSDQGEQDFEDWRNEFFKLAVKGDPNEMIGALKQVRDRELDRTQQKFVEDNLQIQYFRQDHNVFKASQEIRKMIKQQLDRNYPASNLATYITQALEQYPDLTEIFYKLPGFYGMKGDLHRKFMGALLSAVQVGAGGNREDLVYSEHDYSINISTRFATEWGEIALGKWSLQADDPARYLEEPELARLQDGSPEEKSVLRHRIVIASIAERFRTRAFLIHTVDADGIINCLGWDLGDSLTGGYVDGYLRVKNQTTTSQEAMINPDGEIIKINEPEVKFIRKTGKHDITGKPEQKEEDFLKRTNGNLYFNGSLKLLRTMGSAMQGVTFKEVPFNGNPSDLQGFQRCIPSLQEMLMRKC
jgi:hypothetical protein